MHIGHMSWHGLPGGSLLQPTNKRHLEVDFFEQDMQLLGLLLSSLAGVSYSVVWGQRRIELITDGRRRRLSITTWSY